MGDELRASPDVDRRLLLRRAAVSAGALTWSVPVVQSLASPAFAAVSDPPPPIPGWGACLSGRGELASQGTGQPQDVSMTYEVVEPVCCSDLAGRMRVTVVLPGGAREFVFDELVALARCDRELTCDECPSSLRAELLGHGPGGAWARLDVFFENAAQPPQRSIAMETVSLTILADDPDDPTSYEARGPAGTAIMTCSSC